MTAPEEYQKKIIQTAQGLGLDDLLEDSPDYSDVIKKLSVNDLREFWKRLWTESQCSFTRQANINQANFSRWLRGTKNSPSSTIAVRNWLLDPTALNNRYVREKWDKLIPSLSLIEICSHLRNQENLMTVYFLDANNSLTYLKASEQVYKFTESGEAAVVVFSAKDMRSQKLFGIIRRSWCFYVRTPINVKHATLTDIAILATLLHVNLDPGIMFIFVSKIHGLQTIVKRLQQLDRKCLFHCPD